MPNFSLQVPKFIPPRELRFDWATFDGGLNTLFRNTEIRSNELAQAQNLMLVGRGAPTKRWGTAVYHLAGGAGSVRGLKGFYPSSASGTIEILAVTDEGFLTTRSNASYSTLTGVSWASGNNAEMAQLDNRMYIVNGQRELAAYSNPTLVGFATIGQPSGVIATQVSGTSGTNTFGYRLTHVTRRGGETAPTTEVIVANQPIDPKLGAVRVSWTNASAASGERAATNIYGRTPADETFIASVDGFATAYVDDGTSVPRLFAYPPLADSTGGPIAKYIKRFKDRLVIAGISGDSTLLLITGRVPNHEKIDFGSGGGFVRIEPDSGDDITGIEVKGDKIIVFKARSIWEVIIDTVQIGNFFLIEPKYTLITGSVGCASQRSIAHVENDILFLAKGGRGVFVLGNEPGIIGDILRTNEVSVKIRPYFQNLTVAQESNSAAVYYNNKYVISFPGKDETMIFDRERTAWLGPWTLDGRAFEIFYGSDNIVRLLLGDDDSANVDEISTSFPGDRGSAMSTILRTKREDFGNWSVFKNLEDIFTKWRNVLGSVSVDVRIEGRKGNTITAASFTITPGSGNSGWGADIWGTQVWGLSNVAGSAADVEELIKRRRFNSPARNVEIIARTTGLQDQFELLGIQANAKEMGVSFRPSSWVV